MSQKLTALILHILVCLLVATFIADASNLVEDEVAQD